MGTVRDEKRDEESMSDVDQEVSKEDEETDDADDNDDDDDDYSIETNDNGHSEDDNQDIEKVTEPRVLRRAPSRKFQDDSAADKVDQGNVVMSEADRVDVGPGRMKRQRLHGKRDGQRPQTWDDLFKMHSDDWNEDSEDDDWCPIGAIKMPLLWFCTNCTMPNSEKLSMCGKCGENRKSGILTEGHLASSTVPLQATPVSGVGTNTIPPIKDPSSRIFPVDPKMEWGKTVFGFDERMLLHDENPKSHPHPERPDRLRAILAGLAAEGLFPGRCVQRPVREATRLELEQVHSREHVDAVEGTCNEELSYFTSDTYANKDSSLAARLAAGISADLATAIVKGEARNGFALVRPPGHHAEEVTVMGFCLHNNASVAAKAAQAAGAQKVLIVDWDVHHGNGTQDIFEEDPSVLYISLHRHEGGTFYPGTGAADEVGSEKGEGSSVNIPWICSGIGDNDYIYAFLHIVLPIAKQFAPDITIISAGFDAARGDPLGGCEVTPSGYAYMTSMLNSLSGGKMLVILEGGYNLRSISASSSAVIKVLLGDSPGPPLEDIQPTEAGAISMLSVFANQSRYWPTLQMPEFLQRVSNLTSSNSQKKGEQSGLLNRSSILDARGHILASHLQIGSVCVFAFARYLSTSSKNLVKVGCGNLHISNQPQSLIKAAVLAKNQKQVLESQLIVESNSCARDVPEKALLPRRTSVVEVGQKKSNLSPVVCSRVSQEQMEFQTWGGPLRNIYSIPQHADCQYSLVLTSKQESNREMISSQMIEIHAGQAKKESH